MGRSLCPAQMESLVYGLWLHRMTRSPAEANRFGCDHGLVYRPAAGDA